MHATTLKLPLETKEKIDKLAEKLGISAHRFMVEAVVAGIERAQLEAAFIADSEGALARVDAGEGVYSLKAVKGYLAKRAKGSKAKRPVSSRWQK